MFKKLKKRIRVSKGNRPHLPVFGTRSTLDRDWKVLVIAFLVLVLLVCVGGLYFYTRISAQDIFDIDSPIAEEATILNRIELHEALEVLEKEKVLYEEYRENPDIIPDPS